MSLLVQLHVGLDLANSKNGSLTLFWNRNIVTHSGNTVRYLSGPSSFKLQALRLLGGRGVFYTRFNGFSIQCIILEKLVVSK
jgi:hypothetical protein